MIFLIWIATRFTRLLSNQTAPSLSGGILSKFEKLELFALADASMGKQRARSSPSDCCSLLRNTNSRRSPIFSGDSAHSVR